MMLYKKYVKYDGYIPTEDKWFEQKLHYGQKFTFQLIKHK